MYDRQDSSRLRFPGLARVTILLGGIVLGFIVARLFIVSFTVSDDSMLPGLKKGDLVYLLKPGNPGFGDVILFTSPAEKGKVLLKRVVAVDGDIVEVRNKVVYVNNKKLEFSWKTVSTDPRIFPMSFSPRDFSTAVRVERDSYYVLGDNIDLSFDSRFFGPVSSKMVIGKVIYRR